MDNELAEGAIEAPAERSRRRLAVTTGRKEVLVVRETRTGFSEEYISEEMFGTTGDDQVNLKSQYAACSYNLLTFEAYENSDYPAINNGVLTVSIDNDISGTENSVIRNAMTSAATTALGGGSLSAKVDFVMLCVPPGTSGGWIAYAYVNHWLSGTYCSMLYAFAADQVFIFSLSLLYWVTIVYNNEWCNFPSGQLHEIGKCRTNLEEPTIVRRTFGSRC